MQASERFLSIKMSLGKEHLKDFNGAFPKETEELSSPCCSKLQECRYNCASMLVMLKTALLAKKINHYWCTNVCHTPYLTFFSFCTIRKQLKSEIKRFLDKEQVWGFFFLFLFENCPFLYKCSIFSLCCYTYLTETIMIFRAVKELCHRKKSGFVGIFELLLVMF